ncbi:MAG: protein kinase domain-containing protein [Longimicrobiales bacterium]
MPDATAAPAPYLGQWDIILQKLHRLAAPRYEVKRMLALGGMAGVFLAEEPRLRRQVAIKVMAPALMVDPKLVERFLQEARTIAHLSHPNIVTIYEVDEREDLYWFTMTFVGGRTLGQVMSEALEPLDIDVVRAWFYQIGDALAFAHHHAIVHRDIKPGNVLLDLRGNALVTDFGIAKVADGEAGLTRTGMLVGTPTYMSPEQCSSGVVTSASDQYSLGAVVYQMLAGQPPFTGSTLSLLQAHVGQDPVPVQQLRPDCPIELAHAVERMLQKRPEDRWPGIADALAAAHATAPRLDGVVRERVGLLAAPAAGITVTPWSNRAQEGTRQQLKVRVVDADGRVRDAASNGTRTIVSSLMSPTTASSLRSHPARLRSLSAPARLQRS